MRRKIITVLLIAIAITAMLFLTGCEGEVNEGGYSEGELETSTFLQESNASEVNQRKLLDVQPTPTYDSSIQRMNLNMRLDRLNVPNKRGYVYLVSFGKVMSMDVVNGSVYSVNSLLTNPQQIIAKRGRIKQNDGTWTWAEIGQFVVDSPDLDGTYGPDGPPNAVFYFTTDGAYCETDVDYIYYDQPRQMATPPELVRNVE